VILGLFISRLGQSPAHCYTVSTPWYFMNVFIKFLNVFNFFYLFSPTFLRLWFSKRTLNVYGLIYLWVLTVYFLRFGRSPVVNYLPWRVLADTWQSMHVWPQCVQCTAWPWQPLKVLAVRGPSFTPFRFVEYTLELLKSLPLSNFYVSLSLCWSFGRDSRHGLGQSVASIALGSVKSSQHGTDSANCDSCPTLFHSKANNSFLCKVCWVIKYVIIWKGGWRLL